MPGISTLKKNGAGWGEYRESHFKSGGQSLQKRRHLSRTKKQREAHGCLQKEHSRQRMMSQHGRCRENKGVFPLCFSWVDPLSKTWDKGWTTLSTSVCVLEHCTPWILGVLDLSFQLYIWLLRGRTKNLILHYLGSLDPMNYQSSYHYVFVGTELATVSGRACWKHTSLLL
jgi:hypothetical protein